jgi:molybdopterin-containing oxidoreductase family iron-sulfur binding subunit
VKTRDGRPIKIEGNPSHPVSLGAVCAQGQASVLALYDADRARGPRLDGRAASWADVDAATTAALKATAEAGRPVRVVVPFGLGPSERRALAALLERHPGARAVHFDPLGEREALAEAHRALYGAPILPDYRLDEAQVVVSFDADFLGTWLAPAVFGRQWAAGRQPEAGRMLHHVHLEPALTLSGGAADERHPVRPAALGPSLARLVTLLASTAPDAALADRARQVAAAWTPQEGALPDAVLSRLAARLRAAGDRGLVLAGAELPAVQILAALANALLGNTGTTVVLDAGPAGGDPLSGAAFAAELAAGQVGAALFVGVNPAAVDRRYAEWLKAVPFSLSTADRLDETAALCRVHAPEGHAFEAWTDSQPRPGVQAIGQPTVAPLHDTRGRLASLRAWAGAPADDYAFVKDRWRQEIFPVSGWPEFQAFWDQAVRQGVFLQQPSPVAPPLTVGSEVEALVRAEAAPPAGLTLVLQASVALGDGSGPAANNGWLQELPDPITKVAWGNVLAVAPAQARALKLRDGDVVAVDTGAGRSVEAPVLVQAGLPEDVVALALGHGRAAAGRNAARAGADAWPLAVPTPTGLRRRGLPVTVRPTGRRVELALAQTHHSQEGRGLVRQTDLVQLRRDPRAGNEAPHHAGHGLWPKHAYPGHRWAMAIDLSKCTGCGACVVSCQAENNIPVVGPDEVRRRRDMAWLRIDRYYEGTPENPRVLHQPMMCQHCENAPCETVCPVLATVHSSEGLNQQVYNRCVGTRYCANNCPTKVRRFNWFDYPHGEPIERMVLNPDVVVRTRGVMEKCTFCVQRIETGKVQARREGRAFADGDVQTACQQSCPGQAIAFGDVNDPQSAVSRLAASGRAYRILADLNIGPSVSYLTRVTNQDPHG